VTARRTGSELADDGVEGEEECEDGSVVVSRLVAANVEVAAMAKNDFPANPEAGAGDALGGEEGVEDFVLGLRAHASAHVGDGDGDAGLSGFQLVDSRSRTKRRPLLGMASRALPTRFERT
jgi:hypothetical protein